MRKLLIAPALLAILSMGFVARPAHATPLGTLAASSTVNWFCNNSYPFLLGPSFANGSNSHSNLRNYSYTISCPVILTTGYGTPGQVTGSGTGYALVKDDAFGNWSISAQITCFCTINRGPNAGVGGLLSFHAWWNEINPFPGTVQQNGTITSITGSLGLGGINGTGNVLSGFAYGVTSNDFQQTDYFQFGNTGLA